MKRIGLALAATIALGTATAFAEGDPAEGEKVFKRCAACHQVGEGAKNRVGPTLNGVVGREWGAVEDFRGYSKGREGTLLQMAEDEGKVWDIETLAAYLTKPKDVIPRGKMAFAGLRKDEEIANVIAYLASFDADGAAVDPAPVIEAATPGS